MRSRRKAREGALQALYEIEVGGSPISDATERMIQATTLSGDLAAYAEDLIHGVRSNLEPLDSQIAGYLKQYDFTRLASIDRNILRIGAYELIYLPAVPPAVSINEAVELAKKFSTAESGKFVNGVLGRLVKDTPKVNWDPKQAPQEEIVREPEPEIVEETVSADSEEAETLRRFGQWNVNADADGT